MLGNTMEHGGGLEGLLGGLFGGGGGLPSKPLCEEGKVAVPKTDNHKAMTANGCGPQGMQMPEPYGLFRCCNFHDVCFSTCGTAFDWCEQEFAACLKRVCKTLPKGDERKGCKDQSKSFTSLTGAFGKGFYESSQKESCQCVNKDLAAKKHRDYLKAFLEDYHPEEATDERIDAALEKYKGKEGTLYAALVKMYGHNFVKFDKIGAEFEKGSGNVGLDEL